MSPARRPPTADAKSTPTRRVIIVLASPDASWFTRAPTPIAPARIPPTRNARRTVRDPPERTRTGRMGWNVTGLGPRSGATMTSVSVARRTMFRVTDSENGVFQRSVVRPMTIVRTCRSFATRRIPSVTLVSSARTTSAPRLLAYRALASSCSWLTRSIRPLFRTEHATREQALDLAS